MARLLICLLVIALAVPSSAALIFSDPLNGSTSGTTNSVTLQPSEARLTAADSWIKFAGPEIPETAGTLSLRLYIEAGATGGCPYRRLLEKIRETLVVSRIVQF